MKSENDLCVRRIYDEETQLVIDVQMTIHNAILFDYLRKIENVLRRTNG